MVIIRRKAKWSVYQIPPGNCNFLHLPVLVKPKDRPFWDCPLVSAWGMGFWIASCRSEILALGDS